MAALSLFVFLQLCDIVTTVAFLHNGIPEANPMIRFALTLSSHPALPLVIVKVLACVLAWLGWRSGRRRFLRHVNIAFALCVVWNIVALAV
jgi:hypothetical protein